MYYALLTQTLAAAATMPACRFVTGAGAVPAANAKCLGVTKTGATAVGQLMPVDVIGTTEVEASAAIALDAAVATTVDGRAVTYSTGVALGRALQAATAAGQIIEVLLTPTA